MHLFSSPLTTGSRFCRDWEFGLLGWLVDFLLQGGCSVPIGVSICRILQPQETLQHIVP